MIQVTVRNMGVCVDPLTEGAKRYSRLGGLIECRKRSFIKGPGIWCTLNSPREVTLGFTNSDSRLAAIAYYYLVKT